jgi:ribosomal protein S11
MSLTLAVDNKNDLFVNTSGNLATAADIQACMQAAQQAAQTQLGEMQYFVDRGIPNFDVVWNGHPSVAQFNAALRRELMKVTDVVDVPELSTSLAGGKVVYSVTIRTTFGLVAIDG